jgi:hypothetical protein
MSPVRRRRLIRVPRLAQALTRGHSITNSSRGPWMTDAPGSRFTAISGNDGKGNADLSRAESEPRGYDDGLARRRSLALIHRWRPSAPRTRPSHCWRSFTHQSSLPAFDHVAMSTGIEGSTTRRSASPYWFGSRSISD